MILLSTNKNKRNGGHARSPFTTSSVFELALSSWCTIIILNYLPLHRLPCKFTNNRFFAESWISKSSFRELCRKGTFFPILLYKTRVYDKTFGSTALMNDFVRHAWDFDIPHPAVEDKEHLLYNFNYSRKLEEIS